MRPYHPIDLSGLTTISLAERASKVALKDFARPPQPGASFDDFLHGLPNILFGEELRQVIDAIVAAHRGARPVVVGMGAHVIKCGLSPVLIDLMRRGLVNAIALNGAGPIHDVELALVGHTSEDVQAGLGAGSFGMSRETGELIHGALERVDPELVGLGAAIGTELLRIQPAFQSVSLLAAAAELGVPATVHVAIGTDIVHMRGSASGAAIGAASFTDFRLFTDLISDLSGGVYINLGSAVVLPEVFLKAFTIAQNLGARLHDFTTVNVDMLNHYRPMVNVLHRPASVGGRGFFLSGRHELLIPLLAQALVDRVAQPD